MPRISTLSLDQVNRRLDDLDVLRNQVLDLQQKLSNVGYSSNVSDPEHAPHTTNNLAFTWSGGSQAVTWPQGFIKDKNWSAQTVSPVANKSSAKGAQHIYTIPAGSLSLLPSTYYWLGWDVPHQTMIASQDASSLHGNYNIHIICQIFTGTLVQNGLAGGGGANGGVDLSGTRYKNF